MTDSPRLILPGLVAFGAAWALLAAASRARNENRNAMFMALAGFLLGLVGLLVTAQGLSATDEQVSCNDEGGVSEPADCRN